MNAGEADKLGYLIVRIHDYITGPEWLAWNPNKGYLGVFPSPVICLEACEKDYTDTLQSKDE